MKFNLIDEQWIPVKRRDGSIGKIAPHEVTKDFAANPVVALDASRPDFNGALIQFLIGLVQTVAAPKNGADWRKKLVEPPAPDELKERLSTIRHAFELGGDGPRFMQDFEELSVGQQEVDGLLIDMPGESTIKKNTDHFVKRSTVVGMCPSCTATALYTMQTNAPAGGQGNRTSLRGGGPLTTLVVGDEQHETLWQLIWLNILEDRAFVNICGNANLTADHFKFPWLAATRTSEVEQNSCQPSDFHPVVMYWGMPRRIRLDLANLKAGKCDTCGTASDSLSIQYQQKNFGMNFTGAWLHPLSPYNISNNQEPVSVHPQPGGVTYRYWLGLVQQDNDEHKVPARVVHDFINHDRQRSGWQFRLWAFGYDMKNMNARCWYESTIPLLLSSRHRQEYENIVASMVKAAVFVGENLRIALKNSMHGKAIVSSYEDPDEPHRKKIKWKYKDIKKLPEDDDKRRKKVLFETKENTTLVSVESYFWQNTEPRFYELLASILKLIQEDAGYLSCLAEWRNKLCDEAEKLFDLYSWEVTFEDADPKRVVLARKELKQFNRSRKIKELLGIPVEKAPKGKQAKAGKESKQRELPM